MKKIPLIKPQIPNITELKKDLEKMYQNLIFSNGGPFEKKFELKTKKYFGNTVETIAVSNATIGLLLAIKAVSNGEGYVLLPSFTFAATIEAVLYANLIPVFVDVDTKNWSMIIDEKVKLFLREQPVKAILYCNPFGIEGNIYNWEDIASEFNVPLICDSAAGFGSVYEDGSKIGTKGDIEVLSLHATKTFAVGEGGLLVTKSKRLANKLLRLRGFGFDSKHIVQDIGFNAKMGEFYSVVGLHVLKNIDKTIRKKHSLLGLYFDELQDVVSFHPKIFNSALQFLPVCLKTTTQRSFVEKQLKKNGIFYRRYYYPALHKHPPFKNVKMMHELTGTNFLASRMLALPLYCDLKEDQIRFICKVIKNTLKVT